MAKKEEEITIRSSTAEYLTYVASVGDIETSVEMRYEDENILADPKADGGSVRCGRPLRTVNCRRIQLSENFG